MLSEPFIRHAPSLYLGYLLVAVLVGLLVASVRRGSLRERAQRALVSPAVAFMALSLLGEGASRLRASHSVAMGLALVQPTSRDRATNKLRDELLSDLTPTRADLVVALDDLYGDCQRSATDALRLHLPEVASRVAHRCGTHGLAARALYEGGFIERALASFREERRSRPDGLLTLSELTASIAYGAPGEAARLLRDAARREAYPSNESFTCLANALDVREAAPGATLTRNPTDDLCNLLVEWLSPGRKTAPLVASLRARVAESDRGAPPLEGTSGRAWPLDSVPSRPVPFDPFYAIDAGIEDEGWRAPVLTSFGIAVEGHRSRARWLSSIGLYEGALHEIERGLTALVTAGHDGQGGKFLRDALGIERARIHARELRDAEARRALAEIAPSFGGGGLDAGMLDLRATFSPEAARRLHAARGALEDVVATGDGARLTEALRAQKLSGLGIVDLVGRSLPVRREALVPFVAYDSPLDCAGCGIYTLLRHLGERRRMGLAVGDGFTVRRTEAARDRILASEGKRFSFEGDADLAMLLHVAERMFEERDRSRERDAH